MVHYRDGTFVAPTSISAEAMVTATARGRDGRLLGSSMTTGTFRERADGFDVLAAPATLPKSVVIAIVDTPGGAVWLGTRDAGLVRIHDRRTAVIAGQEDQYPAA
jgi:hypothetical protein